MESENRKIKYTKTVLRQSLLQLMGEKPLNKITVTEVCEKADVNRTTYYRYYLDVFDQLEKIENELYDEVKFYVDSMNYAKNVTTGKILMYIFSAVSKSSDICKILLSEHGNRNFLEKITYVAHDRSVELWKSAYPDRTIYEFEYVYTFVANGFVGIIMQWFKNGLRESPEQIVQIVNGLSKNISLLF